MNTRSYRSRIRRELIDYKNGIGGGKSFPLVAMEALRDAERGPEKLRALYTASRPLIQAVCAYSGGDVHNISFLNAWELLGLHLVEGVEFAERMLETCPFDHPQPMTDQAKDVVDPALIRQASAVHDGSLKLYDVIRGVIMPDYVEGDWMYLLFKRYPEDATRTPNDYRVRALRTLRIIHQRWCPREDLVRAIKAVSVELMELHHHYNLLAREIGLPAAAPAIVRPTDTSPQP